MSPRPINPAAGHRKSPAVPALLLLALVLRLVAAFAYGVHQNEPVSHTFPDTAEYRGIAGKLNESGGMTVMVDGRIRHASRAPLYSLFLALLQRAFPGNKVRTIMVLQAVIGAVTCYLVYLFAKRKFGARAGFIAFLLCAIYPFFIFYSGLFLTETLFCLLYVLLNLLLDKSLEGYSPWWWVLSGVVMGLGALTRSELLAFPLVALPIWVLTGERKLRRLRAALLATGVMALVVAPWVVRNAIVFEGGFVPGTTRLGHDLYEANNPDATGGIMADRIDWDEVTGLDEKPLSHKQHEIESDQILREKALEWISRNPGGFLALIPQKQWRMWRPTPAAGEFQNWYFMLASALSYGPIILLALGAVWLLRKDLRKRLMPLLVPVMFVAALHCVFLGSTRYRLPAMPFIIVLAAVALDRIAVVALRKH